jgi:hypothetical protein
MSTLELDALNAVRAVKAEEQQPERSRATASLPGAVIGILIGFKDEGCTPLVLFPGQSSSVAVAAASAIDVHGIHIGRQVVLIFENGDSRRPIIVGLLKSTQAWPLPEQPGQVEVDADGERLIVSAREQLVLRCGKASITLTKAGKVLIQGAYVSNRSSGVMRIKGGSVQIN